MNYNTAFVIAARTAEVHDTVQRWIRNEAPVIEERIKRTALHAAIALLEFIVIVIEFAQSHIERSPEYRLQYQLAPSSRQSAIASGWLSGLLYLMRRPSTHSHRF